MARKKPWWHPRPAPLSLDPYPSTPGLWGVGPAARYVGLTTNALVSGIENGDIPITLYRIGRGQRRFINVAQLLAHFNVRLPAPVDPETENLF